ncbi:DUF488 domain-containing protein [Marinimicrobium agarilyticum]|uniref:DUF488 domain-containing protein n=1 Tax=Marinimicrobium agarilyticum TaxID=306546 RepID=UPI000426AF4D|nr:DUF488 family protein [Marinimicrobium agarilyticum]
MVDVFLKRAHDHVEKDDGARVLVDGLWPRGIKKEALELDDWCKEVAPSEALRKWFNHDPDKWKEFRTDYLEELKDHKQTARELLGKNQNGRLTLVYAAKDREHNHARVLREYLKKMDH